MEANSAKINNETPDHSEMIVIVESNRNLCQVPSNDSVLCPKIVVCKSDENFQ
jgi:hypothetical protein